MQTTSTHPCGVRICKAKQSKQASDGWKNAQAFDRQVLFATLAVVCARWLVSFAHATEPWTSSVLFDFIAFRIIIFWLLSVLCVSEEQHLRVKITYPMMRNAPWVSSDAEIVIIKQ